MAGEQMSQALFNLIEGVVVPSGKLPITLGHDDNEVEMDRDQFPGENYESHYKEELLVGYRWYDYHNKEPNFPFGHGLSYTTFFYEADSIKVDDRNVSITVQNTGDYSGKEVVQLYIGFPE
jgi:beta-glucosidase